MESLVNQFHGAFRNKRVLVTGHTGFKGAWLCEWLLAAGANVTGFALTPPTQPSLFDQLKLARRVSHVIGDVRDLTAIRRVVDSFKPEFVFHLAAQPLVRLSYVAPAMTYEVNVMGTVNVLEALRLRAEDTPCTAVMVTTDKCYENREWVHSYREEDPMGGYDPYSSSKGAAELAIAAYRRSFFGPTQNVRLVSARAGNVIGGGDWADDRIVPDCIRALERREAIPVRNKVATRPWQHVLEPLSGYLWLAARVSLDPSEKQLLGPFNFGPPLDSNRTVADLVKEILKHWPGQWTDQSNPLAVHEAKLLNLTTDKAYHLLNWRPVWSFEESIAATVQWYRQNPEAVAEFTAQQLLAFVDSARARGLVWAN